jgi:hypothetical protein
MRVGLVLRALGKEQKKEDNAEAQRSAEVRGDSGGSIGMVCDCADSGLKSGVGGVAAVRRARRAVPLRVVGKPR